MVPLIYHKISVGAQYEEKKLISLPLLLSPILHCPPQMSYHKICLVAKFRGHISYLELSLNILSLNMLCYQRKSTSLHQLNKQNCKCLVQMLQIQMLEIICEFIYPPKTFGCLSVSGCWLYVGDRHSATVLHIHSTTLHYSTSGLAGKGDIGLLFPLLLTVTDRHTEQLSYRASVILLN